jgi:hypothetical protein
LDFITAVLALVGVLVGVFIGTEYSLWRAGRRFGKIGVKLVPQLAPALISQFVPVVKANLESFLNDPKNQQMISGYTMAMLEPSMDLFKQKFTGMIGGFLRGSVAPELPGLAGLPLPGKLGKNPLVQLALTYLANANKQKQEQSSDRGYVPI